MRVRRVAGVGALGLVLSAGMLVPAGAAPPTDMLAISFRGLIAEASGITEQGSYLTVAGLENAVQTTRVPGTRPLKEVPISGVVAFASMGPFEDPDVIVREVWCIAEDDDAFTMDRKLTAASLEFTCDAMVVDVVCTEWDGDECVGAEEILNEDLTDVITVAVEWTGVGAVTRTMSVNKSRSEDYWWLSHYRSMVREAVATGTVVSENLGTIFDGQFESAQLSNVRDGSIQRGEEMLP